MSVFLNGHLEKMWDLRDLPQLGGAIDPSVLILRYGIYWFFKWLRLKRLQRNYIIMAHIALRCSHENGAATICL